MDTKHSVAPTANIRVGENLLKFLGIEAESARRNDPTLPVGDDQILAIVEKLLEGGIVKASELGQIVVEREEEKGETAPAGTTPEAQRQAQSQGG